MDDEIDENLGKLLSHRILRQGSDNLSVSDLMAANLSRLKNLGIGLAEEIDDQNKLIDRVAVKADKADIVIRDQDKQMKKIMGVKKPKAAEPGKPEGK